MNNKPLQNNWQKGPKCSLNLSKSGLIFKNCRKKNKTLRTGKMMSKAPLKTPKKEINWSWSRVDWSVPSRDSKEKSEPGKRPYYELKKTIIKKWKENRRTGLAPMRQSHFSADSTWFSDKNFSRSKRSARYRCSTLILQKKAWRNCKRNASSSIN